MKVIYNKFLPTKNFTAVNLFGVIFAREECRDLKKFEVNHERIHTRQIIELAAVFYYPTYFMEWLFRLIQYRDRIEAYRNISFEREAYANHNNFDYLKNRKPYSFVHYYKIKKEK
ncbi:MAG: hypothetical protein ACLVKO_06895 [Dysgonomonas sp.]